MMWSSVGVLFLGLGWVLPWDFRCFDFVASVAGYVLLLVVLIAWIVLFVLGLGFVVRTDGG